MNPSLALLANTYKKKKSLKKNKVTEQINKRLLFTPNKNKLSVHDLSKEQIANLNTQIIDKLQIKAYSSNNMFLET